MDQQRYTEKQIDRQEGQTEKDRQNCGGVREADKRTEGQTDRQTDRQTVSLTVEL